MRNKDKDIDKNTNIDKKALEDETPIQEMDENIKKDLGVEEKAEKEKPLHEIRKDIRDEMLRDSGIDLTEGS